jgi:hypothetical protein
VAPVDDPAAAVQELRPPVADEASVATASACTNAVAVGYRHFGSLSSWRRITCSIAGERSSRNERGGGGGV